MLLRINPKIKTIFFQCSYENQFDQTFTENDAEEEVYSKLLSTARSVGMEILRETEIN